MLPVVRLAQTASSVVREQFCGVGQWYMVTAEGEKTLLNRFKLLHLLTRNVMAYFDPFTNTSIIAHVGELETWNRLINLKLTGKRVTNGLELLVWLPHYQKLALLQTLTGSGRRALDGLCVGELYGLASRYHRIRGHQVYLPAPERLNLPVDLTGLPSDREEIQSKFVQGLPV